MGEPARVQELEVRVDSASYDARPFLKWAGGKRRLTPDLLGRAPALFKNYHEPFLGGGALFYELEQAARFGGKAYLSDVNAELINTYQVVRDNVDELIGQLAKHRHTSSYFYRVRGADRRGDFWTWSKIERASRFVFLNKTCFNGLCRVNSDGYFNVPFGAYKNPRILDEENLRACSKSLRNTELEVRSFETVLDYACPGDFVYFDPPYAPLKEASFTTYAKDGFGVKEQTALADVCRALDKKGVAFALSNSDTELIQELYKGFRVEVVLVPRAINSDAKNRGKVRDVIVMNR